MTLSILIPVKPFHLGKTRLSPAVSTDERAQMCTDFFRATLNSARQTPGVDRVHVVTCGLRPAALARQAGAEVIPDPGGGLNAALTYAAAQIDPAQRLAILPTDLPAIGFAVLADVAARAEDVVVVPDRHGDGTNLLVLSPAARVGFDFAYGPDSAARHLAAAHARGLSSVSLPAGPLSLDIDTPADLAFWCPSAPCLALS